MKKKVCDRFVVASLKVENICYTFVTNTFVTNKNVTYLYE